MLGDINPQSVRIAQNAVVYPGRNHVTTLTVKRYDGRNFKPVDLDDLTRVVLVFPDTSPTIVFDSLTDTVFDWAGNALSIDLSDYAMPESIQASHLIVFDAEHPQGQVLVDNIDSRIEFDFRLISTTGTLPPPTVEFITDAPQDGETYGRKDGVWVTLEALVSGVVSVNDQSGVVVLSAADVGAATSAQGALADSAVQPGDLAAVATSGSYTDLSDKPTLGTAAAADTGDFDPAGAAAGAAAGAVAAHVADTTPHETLLGVDRVGFDTTAGLTAGSGELVWNATDATLDLGLPGGSILQVGQEFLVRGRNTSGTTMVDGTVVYVSGALGARAVFSRAQANQSTADKTIGVITQDLANNSDGFCTLAGLVRNFDTSGWAEGAELWLSAATAGALTATKPAPPNNAVRVGQVIRSHATQGQILVRVQIIEALRELHDVNVTAPADGDILVYDSATQTWLNEPNTGGTGEVNTASNLGAGTGLFAGKVGADLQFKSLVEGTGVTITSDATTVTINASGGTGAVDSVNGETGVVVLTTTDIAEGTNLYHTNARASAAAPVQSVNGQTGSVDLSSAYAPLSHIGDGGTAHANVVASGAAGFMTGADKAKLDGVEAGATANQTNSFLLARANHTGTQLSSTISDFNSASRAQTEAELVAGTNVTITPSGVGATRQLTISAAGGGGSTNLSTTTSATTLTVNSDTGTDAVLPAATGSVAGVLTAADKAKLDGVAAGATANNNTDSLTEGSTNLYFTAVRVLATILSGFTLVGGGTVLAADSLLVAIGKLQSQINGLTTALSGKQDTLVSGTNIKTINGASVLGSGDLTVSGGGGMTNPMTTEGDIIVGGTSGTPQRKGIGAEGYLLTVSTGTPEWVAPPFFTIDALIIGGGGGGGGNAGGGGGAGGYLTVSQQVFSTQTFAVVIGAGGSAGASGVVGGTGGNSTFLNLTALGGGGGGAFNNVAPGNGGSGGGGGARTTGVALTGSGTAGQGNNGGQASVSASGASAELGGGGGGGAGGVGGNAVASTAGVGGTGVSSSISGSAVTRAVGGGGGGGLIGATGTTGTANTGNGGGGGGAAVSGGAGGSGVVIVRYLGTPRATGGTITEVGGYTIHTFTSSGSFGT